MRFVIGGAGSSRETNDACRLQCFVVGFFSSIRTALVSGSSPPLHLHDIPAPHWQPSFSSQARSGWFSQTHSTPKQMGQFLSIAKVTYGRSAFLDREFFCPGLPASLALPANRTPGPYPLAYRLAPTVHTRGGQFRFQAAFPFSFLSNWSTPQCPINRNLLRDLRLP